jgi:hypothetical protein
VRWLALALAGFSAACARPEPEPPPVPSVQPRVRIGWLDEHPVVVARAGGALATLEDGVALLSRGATGWQPMPIERAPGLQLTLDDGTLWGVVRFADGDGAPTPRLVAPAHSREELKRRRAALSLELARLPPRLAARVEPHLGLIALISATEGDFADPASHPEDRAASLGIFQWAAERGNRRARGSSLSRFFIELKRRARAREERLFVRAWKQCTKLRFDVRRGDFYLRRKRVAPEDAVARLQEAFGTDALRTYQLVAAADWIDQIRATVVRPGHRGGALIGHGYAEAEQGRLVKLDVDGRPVRLRAAEVVTVGELFRSEAALATVVSLGVNRPHYVETALWLALAPADAAASVASTVSSGQLEEATSLLWPLPHAPDERLLLASFREHALELYPPIERERRARRLVTALLLESR